jgi:hypothetical protein
VSDPIEPCAGCGESTAVGGVFYSDRRVIARSDGGTAFLCSSCFARVRATRTGRPLTDDDVRRVVENGSAAAILWSNVGSIPG